jgi:c-di-GMP-binding flagellar brake protein YcgR
MERRKYTRISLHVPATLSFFQVEGYHTGALANISEGGCYIPFRGNIPTGEQCGVTIVIGEGLDARSYIIAGTIVRNDSKGVGICFNDFDKEKEEVVQKIIEYYKR